MMIPPNPKNYENTSWALAMADCPQDPEWHPEGDVWTHTQMVFSEATMTIESLEFEEERCAVLWAALLHDVAKPVCTRRENGRIIAPGHSRVGAHMAMEIMEQAGLPGRMRDLVFQLIRFHGRPPWIATKDMELETVELSHFCPGRALHALCLADARGRGGDRSTMLQNIELWRMQAEELNCLDGGFNFPNSHARFRFFHQRDHSFLHSPLHFEPKSTLTLTVGLPGAGKDTWVEQHKSEFDEIVSLDELRETLHIAPEDEQGRVSQEANRRVKESLAHGCSVLLNSTSLSTQLRDQWGALALSYGARFRLVYIDPGHHIGGTLKICLSRNSKRQSPVPSKVIQKLLTRLTPPTLAECHELCIYTGAETTG